MKRLFARHRAPDQRGYALILVMVALVTLTILGVTAIQNAQLDMKITQNMRHHKQLQYGSLAGQDHARGMMDESTFIGQDMRAELAPMVGTGGCIMGWISADAPVADVPLDIMVNSSMLASYSANICKGIWGSPPPGNSGHAPDGLKTYSLEIVVTGAVSTMNSTAQSGAFFVSVGKDGK